MRQAGQIPNEADAKRFIDHLLTQSIEAKTDEGDGGWTIWIYDENQLEQSKEELREFLFDPQNARYADVEKQAVAKDVRRQPDIEQRTAI